MEKQIEEITTHIFSPDKFTIKISKYDSDYSIIITTKDATDCLYMSVNSEDANISIDSLDKCGDTKGTELLMMADEFANQIKKIMPNVNCIKLIDGSKISMCDFKIKLWILKILLNGMSWYNSHGYFSSEYEKEKIHNEGILNMEYEEFIDNRKNFEKERDENYEHIIKLQEKTQGEIEKIEEEFATIDKETDETRYTKFQTKISFLKTKLSNYSRLINECMRTFDKQVKTQEYIKHKCVELFPDVKMHDSVKNVFNYLWRNVTSDGCNAETINKYKWLSDCIDKIDELNILFYERELKKTIELKGGRKRRKTKKTAKLNKKKRMHKSMKRKMR